MGSGFGWFVVRRPTGVTEMLSPGTFGHGGAFGTLGLDRSPPGSLHDPADPAIRPAQRRRLGHPPGVAAAGRGRAEGEQIRAGESITVILRRSEGSPIDWTRSFAAFRMTVDHEHINLPIPIAPSSGQTHVFRGLHGDRIQNQRRGLSAIRAFNTNLCGPSARLTCQPGRQERF